MIHLNPTLTFAFILSSVLSAAAIAFAANEATSDSGKAKTIEYTLEKSLTLNPISIDPHGADPKAPWTVHMDKIQVRDIPSTDGNVLGDVRRDAKLPGTYLIVDESDEEWLEFDFSGKTGYVSRMGLCRSHPANLEMIERHGNLPFGKERINRWWGIPLDYEADDLVTLPSKYTSERGTGAYQLRKEAAESVMKMFDAMKADGLDVYLSSSYRAGSTQQSIFIRSMGRRLNQRGTAPPGHSEHQLGTTVDISTVNEGRRALRNTDPQYHWLVENAADYGWRQTYLADNTAETGYIEEPWHWRYIGRN